MELNVDITSLPSLPDPSILPNNPLIPKAFFGFENMNTFEPLKAPTPIPKPQPTPKPNKPEKSEPIVEKVKAIKGWDFVKKKSLINSNKVMQKSHLAVGNLTKLVF